jgi:hypothetical protein
MSNIEDVAKLLKDPKFMMFWHQWSQQQSAAESGAPLSSKGT